MRASLAVTGGVHHGKDAVKCLLAGAHAVQVVSALLLRGPGHLGAMIAETSRWMEENEWSSVSAMRGYMNLARCHDPASYEGMASLHPIGRIGQVSDIVDGILYLEQATFVTGETLHIDGGQAAGH